MFDLSGLPQVLTDRCVAFILEIHGREHYEYQGRVIHQLTKAAIPFASMMQGLWAMENMLDGIGYVQHSMKSRTWKGEPIRPKHTGDLAGWNRQTEQEALHAMKQSSASFLVKIQYRQNATWQGSLEWLDGQRTQHFRSTMELLRLIEEVVDASNIPGGDETDVAGKGDVHLS